MLFNSYVFICAFLPITLAGYALLGASSHRSAAIWLVLCSLFFYGWWNPAFLILLCGSIVFNFVTGEAILATNDAPKKQAAIVAFGVTANLALLFRYKYLFAVFGFLANFDVVPVTWATKVALPLGISFFTFTQIGYLLDCRQRLVQERSFTDYALFVTFFPHLIAGPIIHHKEMMPQFARESTYRVTTNNIAIGLTLFVIGLAKKVLLADQMIEPVTVVFSNPSHADTTIAWLATLSYSLQLYFDFSGYSDMAIGIARMFGIRFPLNFNSPYKAKSIIEFWQRWHMTLTRYLNLYLFNPIAMNMTRRRIAKGLGVSRRATTNLRGYATLVVWPMMATMGLAGIWHGAGLQFLVFGLLHGAYLSINHAWRMFGPKREEQDAPATRGGQVWAATRSIGLIALTYGCVLVGQVFFRAGSVGDAVVVLRALVGDTGASGALLYQDLQHRPIYMSVCYLLVGFAIVWFAPNSQELLSDYDPAMTPIENKPPSRLRWNLSGWWPVGAGALGALAFAMLSGPTEFLYFEF
jgi:D-alanyl-lipoteichoic acid acyltransferase DltB (MBOAT superfamily)